MQEELSFKTFKMDKHQILREQNFLVGWKEIANYIGVSVKTLRRHHRKWGLPIFFLNKEVYKTPIIHKADIEAWRKDKLTSLENQS